MLRPSSVVLFLAYCLLSTGCITPIEFVNNNNEGTLAIYGELSQDPGVKQIRITRTTGFKNGINYILGAKATLYEDNLPAAVYQPADTGIYKIANFSGKIGHSYFVRIETGGQIYESDPELLLAPIQPDSVRVSLEKYYYTDEYGVTLNSPIWNIYAGSPLPDGQETYLRWGSNYAYAFMEDNNCHFPFGGAKTCYFTGDTDPLHISIFSKPKSSVLGRVDNIQVASRNLNKQEMKEREYFGVLQHRISKITYDYWQKTNQQNNQSGSIFDATPASVPGNIHNKGNASERVLGIFEVSGIGKIYGFVTQGDAPDAYKTNSCADFVGQVRGFGFCDPRTSPCYNCLLLKNATLNKPDFWK